MGQDCSAAICRPRMILQKCSPRMLKHLLLVEDPRQCSEEPRAAFEPGPELETGLPFRRLFAHHLP